MLLPAARLGQVRLRAVRLRRVYVKVVVRCGLSFPLSDADLPYNAYLGLPACVFLPGSLRLLMNFKQRSMCWLARFCCLILVIIIIFFSRVGVVYLF